MSIDWTSLLNTVLSIGLAFGQHKLAERPVLAQWRGIGSVARIFVVNPSQDSIPVYASAPEVDDASRYLGVVPPRDSEVFRLPYADTKVRLNLAGRLVVIPVYQPFVTRVLVQAPIELPKRQ